MTDPARYFNGISPASRRRSPEGRWSTGQMLLFAGACSFVLWAGLITGAHALYVLFSGG